MAKIKNPLTYMGGGSPTPPTPQPLDPEQVYRDTRPADWMVLPDPEAETVYILMMIDDNAIDNQRFAWTMYQTVGGTATAEFGTTDSQGVFTPDPALTLSSSSVSGNLTTYLPPSAFTSLTSDGLKQLVCRLHSTSSFTSHFLLGDDTNKRVFEIKGKASFTGTLAMGGSIPSQYEYNLTYFSMEGSSFASCTFQNGPLKLRAITHLGLSSSMTNFQGMFQGCRALVAIPQLDTSHGTTFTNMFNGCGALTTIPQLNTSSGTTFQGMFQSCSSLVSVPQLDTSSGTNFSNMFGNCYSLTTIPQLNTSNGTNFASMFGYCYSLASVPQLDTSSGTNFNSMFCYCYSLPTIPQLDTSHNTSFYNMFQNCYSLTTIPQLNTSNGTNFASMFGYCSSLASVPQLNTSSGTTFTNMFNGCQVLKTVPQLDTSHGTNFAGMFSSCYSLASVPQLNTSSGTNFSNMFASCASLVSAPQLTTSSGTNFYGMFNGCLNLTTVPQLNTSSGTNFSNMFNGCRALTSIPQLDTSSGTNFSNMFTNVYSLSHADLTGYDFSSVTTSGGLSTFMTQLPPITIDLGDDWPADSSSVLKVAFMNSISMPSINMPTKIRINKTDSMLAIGANATTLFGSNALIEVYVPDALLATYQADTYWATLGTRLKAMSEWSA